MAKKPLHKPVKSERALFLNDLHVPFHDFTALLLMLDFARWFKPDVVFLVGDLLDFYAVSSYDRDPHRLTGLQDELDAGREVLARLRQAVGKAAIHYLDGNHEFRLTRYLWRHPEISGLTALQIPELLRLGDLKIEHHGYHQSLQWHGLLIEHGDRVRTHSAATAAAMLTSRGVCGISGHTHRLGAYYRTDNRGVQGWFENGCLCGLRPEYLIGQPNWQQGFSVGFGLAGENRFILNQIPIIQHKIYWEGNLWAA